MPSSPVRDVPERHRFEMDTEAGVAFANYRRDGKTLTIMHTEVPRAIERRGVGSELVTGLLGIVRSRGETVVPVCPFVRHFVQQHSEYADLTQ